MILAGNYFFKPVTEKPAAYVSDCDLIKSKCNLTLAGSELEIYLTGEVKALEKFTVNIMDHDDSIEQASVTLTMKAMDMGNNRFNFVRSKESGWKSDVVIPVCTTGRRDWLFEIEIVHSGIKKRVIFEITI